MLMQISLEQTYKDFIWIKDLSKSERLTFSQNSAKALNSFKNFENVVELKSYQKLALGYLASTIEKGQFNNTINQANIYLDSLKLTHDLNQPTSSILRDL